VNQIVGKKQDGTHFVALVLEPGNLHRLQQGDPIELRLDDFFVAGLPKKLTLEIFYSETPLADAREFAKLAEVAFDERSANKKGRPHCPECRSTIEEIGVWGNQSSPLAVVFCPACGCALGVFDAGALRAANEGKICACGEAVTDPEKHVCQGEADV